MVFNTTFNTIGFLMVASFIGGKRGSALWDPSLFSIKNYNLSQLIYESNVSAMCGVGTHNLSHAVCYSSYTVAGKFGPLGQQDA